MNFKRLSIIMGTLILSAALLLTGCKTNTEQKPAEDKKVEEKKEEVKAEDKKEDKADTNSEEDSLNEWEGVWNNYLSYFDDPAMEATLKEVAEKQGKSVEDLKKAQEESYKADFKAIEFKDGKIMYYDNFKDKGGKVIEEAEYAYKNTHKAKHGNHEFSWYEFEAKGDAKHKVLLLMDVHGEESLTHFHMRYGEDVKTILAQEKWYPTLVKETTTVDQIVSSVKAAADHDHDVSMSDWEGTWNNMGAYLEREELQDAFKKLGEKDGKSADEAKAAYIEKRKCDFDGMVVKGDKVTLLDGFENENGKEIESVEYEFLETHKVKHGNHDLEWHAFKAKGDAKYPIMLMMPVHGEESLTHFHMRYGDDVKALLEKEGWYPTFVKPNTTNEQLVEEITE